MTRLQIGLMVILLGIALMGVSVTAHYYSDMRAVQEHIDGLGSRVVETDCGPIEYARVGDGYPVLVVHGNAGGFDQGLLLANRTIDPQFQVIAPSRFGYLRSPMPANASVALQADAFACLLDSLAIKRAAVVAYSAGSSISGPARHAPPGSRLGADPRLARWPGQRPEHFKARI